jgi:coenzyme F420 hydrogenase subunit delta
LQRHGDRDLEQIRYNDKSFNRFPEESPVHSIDPIYKDVLVLGCGNILYGDDGFGTHVAEHLQNACVIPDHVSVINAGTGVRELLFDLVISEQRPKKVIVVDAVDLSRTPGEVFKVQLEEMPNCKTDDYSLHHMPTTNLLRELRDFCDVEVIIIAAQVESIPEAVKPGLSETLEISIGMASEEVLRACGRPIGLSAETSVQNHG